MINCDLHFRFPLEATGIANSEAEIANSFNITRDLDRLPIRYSRLAIR
jgi:hypothetical protein